MTQQPPMRALRGAVDLSSLARPPKPPADAPAAPAAGSLVVDVTEATFQDEVVTRSLTVPVVIDFWAEWCQPCKQLTPVLERLVAADGGSWVLARIDIDANQRLAGAAGVQSIPMVLAVIGGQPLPLFNGALPEPEVRRYLDEMLRVAAANGISGRVAVPERADSLDGEPAEPVEVPPTPHEEAAALLTGGQIDAAASSYERLLAQAPADAEARRGLALARLAQRVRDLDPARTRADAEARPDDVEAQTRAADLEIALGGADAAFARLVATIRRTSGDDRDRARTHLIELFEIVGPGDPQVVAARSALASALF